MLNKLVSTVKIKLESKNGGDVLSGMFSRFDPVRSGPGVDKNAPPRHRILQFFIIYSKKFQKLILLNLIYFLFSIPAVIIAQYMSYTVFRFFYSNTYNDIQNWLSVSLFIVCVPVVAVGPAHAGFTHILKSFVREEPVFLWSDFMEHAKKNFKQSLIISGINIAVFFVLCTSICWYVALGKKTPLMTLAVGLQGFALLLFFIMNFYVYPMLVTFKLKTVEIYKNALIFAVLKFIPNLLILLLLAVISMGMMFNFIIGFVLMPVFTLSMVGFIINFYVYPCLKKYLIDKRAGA